VPVRLPVKAIATAPENGYFCIRVAA
jgi:hypothetical protein